MRRLVLSCLLLAGFMLIPLRAEARQRFTGICITGNETLNANRRVHNASCTVRVFDQGTANLSTIFSDNAGTALANPFTAGTDGFYFFYANAGRYDVQISAGTPAISSAKTIGDVLLSDGAALDNIRHVNGSQFTTVQAAIDDIVNNETDGGIVIAIKHDETMTVNPFVNVTDSHSIVVFASGTWTLNAQLQIPHLSRVQGIGRNQTAFPGGLFIKASASFPTSTPVVRLGSTASRSFGTRLDDALIDCNSIAGSTGIYSDSIQENSGGSRLNFRNCITYGINIEKTTTIPANFLFEDLIVFGKDAVPGFVGMRLSELFNGMIRRTTFSTFSSTSHATAIEITNATQTGRMILQDIHCEGYTDCVLASGANGAVFLDGVTASGTIPGALTTNLLHIAASAPLIFANALHVSATVTNYVVNDAIPDTVTRVSSPIMLPMYVYAASATLNASQLNNIRLIGTGGRIDSIADMRISSATDMTLNAGTILGVRVNRFGVTDAIFQVMEAGTSIFNFQVAGDSGAAAVFRGRLTVKDGAGNEASTGAVRLPNNKLLGWRNAANNANLTAGYNASDAFAISGASSLVGEVTFGAGGIAPDGGGLKHSRSTAGCATAASAGATCDTTVTWATAFADTNYSVNCSGLNITSGVPANGGTITKIAASIAFRTVAITAAAAQFSNIMCIAVHD